MAKVGWDELLKTRSAVFVMEEEYRQQKANTDIKQVLTANPKSPTGAGTNTNGVHPEVVSTQDKPPANSD